MKREQLVRFLESEDPSGNFTDERRPIFGIESTFGINEFLEITRPERPLLLFYGGGTPQFDGERSINQQEMLERVTQHLGSKDIQVIPVYDRETRIEESPNISLPFDTARKAYVKSITESLEELRESSSKIQLPWDIARQDFETDIALYIPGCFCCGAEKGIYEEFSKGKLGVIAPAGHYRSSEGGRYILPGKIQRDLRDLTGKFAVRDISRVKEEKRKYWAEPQDANFFRVAI
ncbi:MAG: hypothetical protein ABIF88_02725 [archaeon]